MLHAPAQMSTSLATANGGDARRGIREASRRPTIFVSYSRRDRKWLERLRVHLRPLARREELDLWDDTRIDAGDEWRTAIRQAIDRAAASILLISADFLASDFVASHELPPLLEKAESAGARIIPIIVQPCRLTHHRELARFQTVNPPTEPLSRLPDPEAEEVFVRAVEQVERVLALHGPASMPLSHAAGSSAADASDTVFRELRTAAIAMSLLRMLADTMTTRDYTVSELTTALECSRRVAYESVERLARIGWVAKRRSAGRTAYQIADEGIRQWQRLAGAEGPCRRDALPG